MRSLNALVANVRDAGQIGLSVDITAYCQFPEKDEAGEIIPEIITYREPGVNELYTVLSDLDEYRKRAPDIAPDTAFNVALLALCHLTPEPEPNTVSVGELYLALATEKDPLLFLHIVSEFRSRYQWVNQWVSTMREKNA